MTNATIQKTLSKKYLKHLNKQTKQAIDEQTSCLPYLASYLRLMRDYSVLQGVEDSEKKDYYLSLAEKLSLALAEYDQIDLCKNNFFDQYGHKNKKYADYADQDVLNLYNNEYKKHWTYFWAIVAESFKDYQ